MQAISSKHQSKSVEKVVELGFHQDKFVHQYVFLLRHQPSSFHGGSDIKIFKDYN